MTWHLGRMCGFDLETTGVDTETDRIVTACVVMLGGKLPTQATTWLANPGVEIPEGAAKVHGITTEVARAEGQPAGQVVEQIVAELAQASYAGIPIVIMNASFDLTLLDREAERHRVHPLTGEGRSDLRVVDPRVLDRQVDRYRSGKRTLTHLCQHYDVRLDGAHSADADAVAACRVAWRQATRYPQLAAMTLDELHTAQVGWAAEQAASLQEHFRQTRPDAVVEGAWPLIPRQKEATL
ncbi:3'-5' exonuclease [Streptomyces sp. NPDC006995]|uniref:3'-5' exonuclease n=1 Tax=Streptomyces sp. NPDC006995 TaxID=3156907 RepID=UPI0033FC294F